jgi:predicted RNA binding protein YcfA (HicA-like mRNA interferase family)
VTQVPLCSSREIINALQRAGFRPARDAAGDHQAFVRDLPDGRRITTIVLIGEREVPRGTLRKILRLAEMTVDEFVAVL